MPVYIANPEHCQECGYWHYTHKSDCSKYVVEPVSNDKIQDDTLRKELEDLRAEVEAIKEFIRANGLSRKSVPGYWEES